jgi:tRNA(Met) C34 N-acetyltransferase TmcA
MKGIELRTLQHRSERLRRISRSGTATEIHAARELLRRSLVALYELGHWQNQPNDLQTHMQLYRATELYVSAPLSSSVPDRMVRYSL